MTGVNKIDEVRKLRFVQGLPIKEIVRRACLARNTIRKILRSNKTKLEYHRTEQVQPVTGTIRETMAAWLKEDLKHKRKNRRTAWRMYEILRNDDAYKYKGSYESVAKCVRELKKKLQRKEAYIPLIYEAGEAFQFDWGEVNACIGGKLVTLYLAVVELCYSRHIYLRVYESQKQEIMLDAHRRAFEYFGGVCRRGIYDNLKTAVKKLLKGHHRNLQERFVRFSSHYLYEPNFCNPARGNEKGRVESRIGYVRRNFFVPLQHFNSIEELNSHLQSFAAALSHGKKHPDNVAQTCWAAYEEERGNLIELPPYGFECCRVQPAIVNPIGSIYFDNNEYSVSDERVGDIVQAKGYADEVVISSGSKEITRHKRMYGKGQQSLNPMHYLSVLSRKPGALRNGKPFKDWKLPEIFNDYRRALNRKYPDGDRYYAKTLVLLKDWPLVSVVDAIKKAMSLGVLGDSYILSILRHKELPDGEVEYISVKIELARYKAKQKPLIHYDRVLRFKAEEEMKNEQR